jgi:bacillithiol disulfide reductase
MRQTRVVIVGAGPIGLELAVALKQEGIDYLQFDQSSIGATIAWYPLQMQFHSNAERLAIAGVAIQTADQQKPTREEYLAYLRAVVLQHDLQIRGYERVESIRPLVTPSGSKMPGGRVAREANVMVPPTRPAPSLPLGATAFEVRTSREVACAEQVVIAIGSMHRPRLLNIPGEGLPHVAHYFREAHDYFGQRLVIIGGKNSAIEAAIRCQRAGANVTLAYRKPDFDPAHVKFWLLPEIRSMVRDARVRVMTSVAPVEIKSRSIVLQSTEDGSLTELDADFVLMLTGYEQDTSLLEGAGVAFSGDARVPHYDEETMETNVPGLFLAGTAVQGSPVGRVRVIVENCHVHVPRIVNAIRAASRRNVPA